jgi:hypothetical protein
LELTVEEQERADLERYDRGRTTGQALALRARIVLSARGKSDTTVAYELETDPGTVGKGGNASEAAGRAG